MELNLSFWPENEAATCVACIEPECVARPWCDPSRYTDVVGVDFGKGEVHVYWCSTGRKKKADASSARHLLLSLPEGTLVVGEWAHLAVPRQRTSLAQPFTAEELLHLYDGLRSRGVTLKLFPHAHSGTRALGWSAFHFDELAGAKKTDANDAMAIALYVKHCNGVSLANPPKSFAVCNRRNYGLAVAKHANIVLNAERSGGYRGKTFRHVINLAVAIKKQTKLGMIACYSIAALIATEVDGKPCMYARDGKPPGAWLWARHVARMTPFHHYAGIARSNLMRHSFRPFFKAYAEKHGVTVGSKAKYVPFGQHDQKQRAMRTEAIRAFRRAIIEAYRAGVEIASKRGFQLFDPMSCVTEANRGR
jgi:hypothetical protein